MLKNIKRHVRKFLFKTYMFFGLINDKILGEIEKRFKGVDFLINVPPKKLGKGYDKDKYVEYVPSKAWQIKRVIRELNINNDDSILDFGCGKGKVLYEFSKFPFKKIGGVELSTELATIAQENMKKLNLDEIKVYEENALNFKMLDEYNLFYFFDPFNKEILGGVLDNIIESCNKNPREIKIVYLNPRGHDEVLEIKGFSHLKTLQIPMKALFYRYSPSAIVD